MFTWIWVLIPITAIVCGALRDYWKLQARQERLGESTAELGATVRALQEERDRLVRRVENLEAVVTSRLWDATRAAAAPADVARLDVRLSDVPEEAAAADQLRRLAGELTL